MMAQLPAERRSAVTPVPVYGLFAEAPDATGGMTMHEWDVALMWIGVA